LELGLVAGFCRVNQNLGFIETGEMLDGEVVAALGL
jgi:hypothetical protein